MATVTVGSIVRHFESLPDPRDTRNRKHRLVDVIVIAICGMITGCEGPTAIAQWAKYHRAWLTELLELPEGLPSRDCLRRVLTQLQPEAFQRCFQEWIAASFPLAEGTVRHIALDGKTLRRSHNRGQGLGPLHIVSAWSSGQGLSLGQLATEEKSNEITAIPALLDQLDVRKAIVTIDAMGCQKEIAAKIIAGKGDYVLAVKDNHPKLRRVLEEFFAKHLEDDLARVEHRRAESRERGHGREEERFYYLAKLPNRFPLRKEWPGLKAIGLAVRITQHAGGKETQELRYYISSKYLSGANFANVVRQHWGIEALHWVLDVNFNEDQTRTQERRLANNLSWLRRFAVGLLKKLPGNESLKGKQRAVNWSTDVLTQLLTLQGS